MIVCTVYVLFALGWLSNFWLLAVLCPSLMFKPTPLDKWCKPSCPANRTQTEALTGSTHRLNMLHLLCFLSKFDQEFILLANELW